MTYPNSSGTLGTIEWEITEAPDWRTIHRGSRDIGRDDIEVVEIVPLLDQVRQKMSDLPRMNLRAQLIFRLLPVVRSVISAIEKRLFGSTKRYRKQIHLEGGFYLELSASPLNDRKHVQGFGMIARHEATPTFSWEWFDVEGNREYARKLQEGGRLRIGVERGRSGWEIAYTEFLTDISLRMKAQDGPYGNTRKGAEPRWRVRIARGSHVSWPSVDECDESVPPG